MSERNTSLDALKFILIVFVCIGHLMQCSTYDMSIYEDALYRFIYSFHVPAFAFLSGLFTNRNKSYVNKSPYLIETILWGNVIWYFINDKKFDIDILLGGQYHLWYLVGLIIWRVLLHLLAKRFSDYKLLGISVFLYFAINIFPTGYFALYLTFTYFPFFVFGNVINNMRIKPLKAIVGGVNICKAKYLCLCMLFVYCLYLIFPEIGSITHRNTSAGLLWFCLDRGSFIIIAPVLILCILQLNNRIKYPSWVSNQGKNNLVYYVYHGFYRTILLHFMVLHHYAVNLWTILLMTCIIMVTIYPFTRIKRGNYIMNPISSLLNRKMS